MLNCKMAHFPSHNSENIWFKPILIVAGHVSGLKLGKAVDIFVLYLPRCAQSFALKAVLMAGKVRSDSPMSGSVGFSSYARIMMSNRGNKDSVLFPLCTLYGTKIKAAVMSMRLHPVPGS